MLELAIFGLATWRVSYFLIEDDGPFRVAARLRAWAGVDRPGELSGIAFMFTCMFCMSVWVAGVLWFAFSFDWGGDNRLAVPEIAAYSAIAIVINKIVE